jgi:DNA helicase II / ATP-dependent DNA helicase PcrA
LGDYSRRAPQATLAGFLQEAAVNGNETQTDKESKLNRDAVALMTLHAAKGLEFREVYMVGMEEGTLPHHRSISAGDQAVDEERRLCYVGVTRAQRRLTLTLALSRMKWGKPRPTIPSRFLYELNGKTDSPNYLAAKRGQAPSKRSSAGKPQARPTGR